MNAILVPEGGQIPLDVENLASKGIFHVVCSSILLAATVLIDGFYRKWYRILFDSIM